MDKMLLSTSRSTRDPHHEACAFSASDSRAGLSSMKNKHSPHGGAGQQIILFVLSREGESSKRSCSPDPVPEEALPGHLAALPGSGRRASLHSTTTYCGRRTSFPTPPPTNGRALSTRRRDSGSSRNHTMQRHGRARPRFDQETLTRLISKSWLKPTCRGP